MTLGGLLTHLAFVGDYWFSWFLHGNPLSSPWDAVDWDTDPTWDWRTAADQTREELVALWQGTVDRSRVLLAQALTVGGLDQLPKRTWGNGDAPGLRRVVVHMIER